MMSGTLMSVNHHRYLLEALMMAWQEKAFGGFCHDKRLPSIKGCCTEKERGNHQYLGGGGRSSYPP